MHLPGFGVYHFSTLTVYCVTGAEEESSAATLSGTDTLRASALHLTSHGFNSANFFPIGFSLSVLAVSLRL